MNKKVKIILLIVVIIGALVVVAGSMKPTAAPVQTGLSSTGDALGGAVAKQDATSLVGIDDFSSALANVRSITIDTSIFSDPGYKALQANPVILGTDVVGRVNPFAPIGSDPVEQVFSAPQEQTQVVSANGASITTGEIIKIKKTTATAQAQASFDPGADAAVIFLYGTTEELGSSTTPLKVKTAGPVSVSLVKLTSKTQYFIKAVLVIGDTTVEGDVLTFTTL